MCIVKIIRFREETNVSKEHFGLMPGRSTMESIFRVRQLIVKCKEKKNNLAIVFIDPEKAYDMVEVLWRV